MRNVLSIVSFVLAGFFVYAVCFLAFTNMGAAKYFLVGVFSIPVFAFSLLGIKLNKSRAWKNSVGMVFMWGAVTTVFAILSFICMLATPDMNKILPADIAEIFSDYLAGTAITILFFVMGYGLHWLGNQPPTEQIASENAAHEPA
jgi:hypothetical protein